MNKRSDAAQAHVARRGDVDAKPIKVGLLGIGTVGGGTFNVLRRNQEEIRRRAGREIKIAMVADLDTARAQAIVGDAAQVVADARQVIANAEIDIVVELIGGYGVARALVLESIAAGKHVVTANKALLAVHGTEIFAAASEKGVVVAFEAAVAGGIPIIKALREGLTANRIEWIAGIINGTTNFILSEMRAKGLDFDAVLKEAQALGYAEADPTFDIEGIDAAHKATIMSAIAFGTPVQFNKAYVEGITKLQGADIRYAEQLGYRIKLLGITKRRDDLRNANGGVEGIELRVHPTLVPAKRLIANVEGAMNAVVVHGDAVGSTLHYGKGAGAEPTASAVIADLVDITRLHAADPDHRVPHLAFQPGAMQDTRVLAMDEVITAFYLRLRVADRAGVLAQITAILAEGDISIDALLQRPSDEGASLEPRAEGEAPTDVIILTHDTVEGRMNEAIAKMQALPTVLAPIVRIRKEELS
jgi:homoserine dehydrogenase